MIRNIITNSDMIAGTVETVSIQLGKGCTALRKHDLSFLRTKAMEYQQ